jgi:hypothetical protein
LLLHVALAVGASCSGCCCKLLCLLVQAALVVAASCSNCRCKLL